jgi:hypothetical protein
MHFAKNITFHSYKKMDKNNKAKGIEREREGVGERRKNN